MIPTVYRIRDKGHLRWQGRASSCRYVGIDPNADPDHDGMSNYAEFWAGPDPLDSDSVLIIKSVSLLTDGYTQITWQSEPGKSYIVRYSSDFNTWTDLGNTVQGD